ncbi:MAG: SPOR domain-containing protein [Prevotellaceae bacterium]|jgi:nucleoid DNA-binding protein|nr:SPOR domain-containing protein [Prevotellaceae bacterium]
MEEVAKLLIELLRANSRVSLPGMGAFVASPQAAVIDNGKIIPPTKKVAFIKTETWNDGLLEQLYAERHCVNIEVARERLHRIISNIRFELDANGKVTLSGLGTLRQTASRDISFGLAKNLNLQKDSYGLGEVKFPHYSSERGKKKASSVYSKSNIPLLVALCIILSAIAALTLFLWLSRLRDKDNIEALIAMPDDAQPEAIAAPPAQDVLEEFSNAHAQPSPPEEEHQAAATPHYEATPRCEFCTVVASFNTLEGARIKEQRYRSMGYKSRVVDGGNGRYRVMLGCYSTLEAAKRGLDETTKFVKDAWVLEVCR